MSIIMRNGFRHAVRIFRQYHECAQLHAERRKTRKVVSKAFTMLCDAKCRVLKSTGVFRTEHENLEQAILYLAYAIEDYRDGV